jgi:glycosyltransferase involved in cell wall biosynthesis
MKLLLLFDHRFFRAQNGQIFSDKAYNCGFFQSRYLRVFDEVVILARVADTDLAEPPSEATEGSGVRVLPLPDWTGLAGYLRARPWIVRCALAETGSEPCAVLMIAPGGIGSLAYNILRRHDYTIALEVVSDPWEAFQPKAVAHPLRPILRRWLCRALRNQCAKAVAVSYVTNQVLQKRYPCLGFSTGISDVVLPRSAFACSPRNYAPSSFQKTVIYVGVMSHWFKGHDILIDSLVLLNSRGIPLNLVLVGDGGLRSEIETRIVQNGLSSTVSFKGQLAPGEAIRSELDRADLFVLPSRTEGMPRALLEAMARALPCVASSVGGVPEVLDSECLVPPGDARALSAKLQSVLSDPQEMSRMSARNLQKALDYEDSKLSSKRQDFYRQVRMIAESHRPSSQSLGVSQPDFVPSSN